MAERHEAMKPKIQLTFDDNYRVYGVHKIWKQLRRQGEPIGRDQVGRLMGELGLEGVRRGKKPKTTKADPAAVRPPDLVDRDFSASRPNQLWVTDFTYVATWSGFAFTAFVIDVFSRMIVGWRVATSMTTDLVLDTLEMALWRGDERVRGVICHSDARALAQRRGDRTGDASLRRLVQQHPTAHRDRQRPAGRVRRHLLLSATGHSGRMNESGRVSTRTRVVQG